LFSSSSSESLRSPSSVIPLSPLTTTNRPSVQQVIASSHSSESVQHAQARTSTCSSGPILDVSGASTQPSENAPSDPTVADDPYAVAIQRLQEAQLDETMLSSFKRACVLSMVHHHCKEGPSPRIHLSTHHLGVVSTASRELLLSTMLCTHSMSYPPDPCILEQVPLDRALCRDRRDNGECMPNMEAK
jgi:hypothetical protein